MSEIEENIFTVKLHDVIIPATDKKALKTFDDIFIVMDFLEQDLSSIFKSKQLEEFTEKHVVFILYNLLCSLNFLETAKVIHRDLKPSNILINDQCGVRICDFGLARSMPVEGGYHLPLSSNALCSTGVSSSEAESKELHAVNSVLN